MAKPEVGWSVPQDIELEKFPKAVLSEAGELAACRYFIADDQLAIVDPEDDKVADRHAALSHRAIRRRPRRCA